MVSNSWNQTWKLCCILNAEYLSYLWLITKAKIAKGHGIIVVEYMIVAKCLTACHRWRSAVSLFNCLTTVDNLVLMVVYIN